MNTPMSEISIDDAANLIEEIGGGSIFNCSAGTVHSGTHARHGHIHIFMPVTGLPVLLRERTQHNPADPQKN